MQYVTILLPQGTCLPMSKNAYSCNLEGWMPIGIQIGIVMGMEQDIGFIIKVMQTDTIAGRTVVTDCISVAVVQ